MNLTNFGHEADFAKNIKRKKWIFEMEKHCLYNSEKKNNWKMACD